MVPAARLFQMMNCLGQGGFGVVYRATMLSPSGLRTTVAVKLLKDPTPDALRRLRKEGRLLAALTHPAILRVHDQVTLAGRVALVTEFVDGQDLTDLIRPPDAIPARALVEMVGIVAEALDAAWATCPPGQTEPLQLVHRDIKPSNLRIGSHGEVKVLDFGIAWADEDTQSGDGTRGTGFIGSIPYMAPERFGNSAAQTASDIYALGCTLYEGLAHVRLHDEVTLLQMAQRSSAAAQHDAHVAERLAVQTEWPADLVRLVKDMLSFRAEDRPPARDVATFCERIVDELPGLRLKAWARARRWESTTDAAGPLSGHAISEGGLGNSASQDFPGFSDASLATPSLGVATTQLPAGVYADETSQRQGPVTASSLTVAPPARRRIPEAIGALVSLVVVIAAIGWMATSPGTAAAPAPALGVPTEPAATVIAPPAMAVPVPAVATSAPTPTAPPAVEPPPLAALIAKAPPPRVPPKAPTTTPVVTAPPVEPTPVAAPPPPAAPGRFQVLGDVSAVELRGAAGNFRAGSEVPPGGYRVFADFGNGLTDSTTRVELSSGATVKVRCNPMSWECEAVR